MVLLQGEGGGDIGTKACLNALQQACQCFRKGTGVGWLGGRGFLIGKQLAAGSGKGSQVCHREFDVDHCRRQLHARQVFLGECGAVVGIAVGLAQANPQWAGPLGMVQLKVQRTGQRILLV